LLFIISAVRSFCNIETQQDGWGWQTSSWSVLRKYYSRGTEENSQLKTGINAGFKMSISEI
jgi:hypothetical protein